MKKLTKGDLRLLGIFNEYGFADDHLYICYHPADNGRGGCGAKWAVVWGRRKTDPNSHFMDYYRKTFSVRGRDDRAPRLAEAMEWASKKYEIKEWAKTPFGSMMEASFVAKRTLELQVLRDRVKFGVRTCQSAT